MIRQPLALAGVLLLASSAVLADDLHVIAQQGRAFHPGEISIRTGQALIFSNRDDFIHQLYVKSDAMNFDSDEQPPGQDVSINFPAAGTFEVRCHIHPKMSLTVHVK
jgi:plastocyanin